MSDDAARVEAERRWPFRTRAGDWTNAGVKHDAFVAGAAWQALAEQGNRAQLGAELDRLRDRIGRALTAIHADEWSQSRHDEVINILLGTDR